MITSQREQIWQIVAAIPAGKVATYGQVARLAGLPNHARHVGTTLRLLPVGSRLPWHRVVNAKGALSFPEGSESWHRQKSRLEQEGIEFHNGRINLRRCQWSL